MPISSLRHAFSDTVADVDGFLVRTRLGNRGAAAVVPPTGRRGFIESLQNPDASTPSCTSKQLTTAAAVDRSGHGESPSGDDGPGSSGIAGLQVRSKRSRSNLSDERPVESVATMTGVRLATTDRGTSSTVIDAPTSTHRSTSNSNGVQFRQPEQPEALCSINCYCCCAGKLLLMWLQGHNLASPSLANAPDRPPLLSTSSVPAGGGGNGGLSSTEASPFHRSRVQSPSCVPQSRPSFGTAGGMSLAGSFASAQGVPSGTGRGSAATLSEMTSTTTTTHDVADMKAAALAAAAAASASMTTADSEDTGGSASDGNQLGRIQFSLVYNFQTMTLNLKIINATNLAAKDISGTSDPYVKVMLLPDKKRKLTTNIKRRNLNPRWNEQFSFEGFPFNKLLSRTLYLQVMDYDRFCRDDPIGEICIPLSDVDLLRGQTFMKTLQPCVGHTGKLGEILLSLCYQPTAEILSIVIIEARELKSKDINGLSDPYVKIWLMLDGKKVEKRKTPVSERTLNPTFNELFMFQFPYERVRQTSLVISVMDHDRFGRNELIGKVVLGAKSGPIEVKHWNAMFAKTRQPVAHWHVLRDFR